MSKRSLVDLERCSYTKLFHITTRQEELQWIGGDRENMKIVSERMVTPNAI